MSLSDNLFDSKEKSKRIAAAAEAKRKAEEEALAIQRAETDARLVEAAFWTDEKEAIVNLLFETLAGDNDLITIDVFTTLLQEVDEDITNDEVNDIIKECGATDDAIDIGHFMNWTYITFQDYAEEDFVDTIELILEGQNDEEEENDEHEEQEEQEEQEELEEEDAEAKARAEKKRAEAEAAEAEGIARAAVQKAKKEAALQKKIEAERARKEKAEKQEEKEREREREAKKKEKAAAEKKQKADAKATEKKRLEDQEAEKVALQKVKEEEVRNAEWEAEKKRKLAKEAAANAAEERKAKQKEQNRLLMERVKGKAESRKREAFWSPNRTAAASRLYEHMCLVSPAENGTVSLHGFVAFVQSLDEEESVTVQDVKSLLNLNPEDRSINSENFDHWLYDTFTELGEKEFEDLLEALMMDEDSDDEESDFDGSQGDEVEHERQERKFWSKEKSFLAKQLFEHLASRDHGQITKESFAELLNTLDPDTTSEIVEETLVTCGVEGPTLNLDHFCKWLYFSLQEYEDDEFRDTLELLMEDEDDEDEELQGTEGQA